LHEVTYPSVSALVNNAIRVGTFPARSAAFSPEAEGGLSGVFIAFSSEVVTGSREENASRQHLELRF
jgi:hypothetical protein